VPVVGPCSPNDVEVTHSRKSSMTASYRDAFAPFRGSGHNILPG
jgi:hypothetical protein